MITGPIATIIAAGIAAAVAVFGSIAMIYHRLGRLEQAVEANKELVHSESARLSERIDRLSDKMDAQHLETMTEIRRLFDALLSHSHDPDLGIIFRVPPGNGGAAAPQTVENLEDTPA